MDCLDIYFIGGFALRGPWVPGGRLFLSSALIDFLFINERHFMTCDTHVVPSMSFRGCTSLGSETLFSTEIRMSSRYF
jgi:hypothetical protein